ncbi:MAG: acyltransferase [Muribaculum sp.]|nr:acyltransferase [Muribaculum sp.]
MTTGKSHLKERNDTNVAMGSLKTKIYFSPLGRLVHYYTRLMSALGKKGMVYGYRCRKSGRYLPCTRIGNDVEIVLPENLEIGDNVWIGSGCWIDASGGLSIGEGCQISARSCLISHTSHISQRLLGKDYMKWEIEDRPGYIRKKTEIGDYTYLGCGVQVLPGVKIGRGCVIGAGAIVTHNLPDYAVAVGNPARIIGDTRDIDRPYLADGAYASTYYEKTT